jgi:N-hydroxyarylamine O-acetyltransferase
MFAWLLKEIGFEVTYLNARVYSKKNNAFGIDFDHLALLVGIPNDPVCWLADVGFGDSFTQPLRMDTSSWQEQGLRSYRVEPFGDGYQVCGQEVDGKTSREYYFDLAAHSFPFEYEAACVYHQTSPNSSFTKNRIISRATDDGRVSLSDKELIITTNEGQTKTAIREDERTALLKEYFDVVL